MRYALLIWLGVGCVATDDTTGETALEISAGNGTSLNGTSLNGTSLNGTSLNGTSLNGTSVNGRTATGAKLATGSSSGPPLSGSSFVGSTWTGTASNGVTVPLRIDSALQGTAANLDLWFYGVSYQTSSGWLPLCGVDGKGVPIRAVAVAGSWGAAAAYATSNKKFTWACRGNTVAKCVELGYKTWTGRTNQLASCVRLLRGDYCGTGVAYTVDGTLLNLYDNVGVQADTQAWTLEGQWGPNGATCVGLTLDTRFLQQARTIPPCLFTIAKATCGTFESGTYLLSELPPL